MADALVPVPPAVAAGALLPVEVEAQGAEVVDNGTGDLAARWTVTNVGTNKKSRFKISGGTFFCTVQDAGTMVIFR